MFLACNRWAGCYTCSNHACLLFTMLGWLGFVVMFHRIIVCMYVCRNRDFEAQNKAMWRSMEPADANIRELEV